MKVLRCLVMGLAILGFVALDHADAAIKIPNFLKKKKTAPPTAAKPGTSNPSSATAADSADDGGIFTAPLVSRDVITKLKLTSEQKPDVDKLQKEFADKLKDIAAKAKQEAADKTSTPPAKGKGKGKGPAGKSGDAPGVSDAISLRSDYEDKVYDLLNETQQKIWLDLKTKKGEGLLTGGTNGTAKTPPKK